MARSKSKAGTGETGGSAPPCGAPDSLNAREKPSTKAERIDFIVGLMADNRWVTGVTGRQLAKEWGCSYDTLRQDAAEASRFFKLDPQEREARQARWHAKIESAQQAAMQMGRLEALGTLLKLEGDHLGVFEAQKVDLNVSGSDEQLTRRLAALIAGGEEAPDPGAAEPGRETSH
jgi:hypothetical protein